MEIYLGEKGLDKSHQAKFLKTIECHKCKGEARIMFVGFESGGKMPVYEYVNILHENKGEGRYWFHDACAVAVYLCKECFEPNTVVNQA